MPRRLGVTRKMEVAVGAFCCLAGKELEGKGVSLSLKELILEVGE